jgi:GTP diphosphokinase / guanosine-3',5'-bis(diphosphate) 3'-diphosphatase
MIQSLKNKLIERCSLYLDKKEVEAIEKTVSFAEDAHKGQVRKSGEPYISHPLDVAYILAEIEQDSDTVIAGILHDTVEDTDFTSTDIKEKFGEDVQKLVDGVTKLGTFTFSTYEEAQAENYRRMLVAMSDDIRVIIIKLADRLHNMRTLKVFREDKQKRISQETLDIYAPLANRLGMASIKWELEDLALFYLDYDSFQHIKKLVSLKRTERESYIQLFRKKIEALLEKENVPCRVKGRPKNFYSIHKKLLDKGISFEELYDALGIRVIVSEVQECYQVLGVLHSNFKPVAGRFKDYIAMPKSNMYQSLHTTVLGPEGKPVEIQIRTKQMHQVSEYGIAAHWEYKNTGTSLPSLQGDFSWLQEIIEEEDRTPKDFLRILKVDLFQDDVFIFTPDGDVKVLIQGATPLDFSYRIHTEVGHTTIGAKVNGRMVSLQHVLTNGDQVEILTSRNQTPKPDWLNWVVTRHARSKIQQYLRKQDHDQLLEKAREKIEKTALINGLDIKNIFKSIDKKTVFSKFGGKSLSDLLLKVAQGEISSREVLKFAFKEIEEPLPPSDELIKTVKKSKKSSSQSRIKVLDEKNILVTLAKCCAPLPGDDIQGIVSIGKGVSVHRADCSNLLTLDESQKGRLVDVSWDIEEAETLFSAVIMIEVFDRVGVIQDVINRIADLDVNILDISTKLSKKGEKGLIRVVVEIQNIQILSKVNNTLLSIPDVIYVGRELHN